MQQKRNLKVSLIKFFLIMFFSFFVTPVHLYFSIKHGNFLLWQEWNFKSLNSIVFCFDGRGLDRPISSWPAKDTILSFQLYSLLFTFLSLFLFYKFVLSFSKNVYRIWIHLYLSVQWIFVKYISAVFLTVCV